MVVSLLLSHLGGCEEAGKEKGHIRSHLLGDKCSAVSGSPSSCTEDTMEELHINVDDKAESQLMKRKQEEKTEGGVIEASSKKSCENGTDNRLRMKGKEKMTAVEQQQPPGAPPAPDLETFFEGFGVKGETIAKLKELGFTSKAFTANFDELPLIVVSIKQHSCHLTIEEEQGIKCAAKYWQKGIIKMMAVEQKWKEKMTAVEQGIKCIAKHWQKGVYNPTTPQYQLQISLS
ncbi:hypothetical protein BDL97_16G092900 [Sphagnum fallax]|nr:hypothetical protein BDL97_16G092900 [Sphagnum fallax]